MVAAELVSTLKELSRFDKFYIVQILISELAQQETDLIKPDQAYPVWSPYDSFGAGAVLMEALQQSKLSQS
jgi:hypothetical protein